MYAFVSTPLHFNKQRSTLRNLCIPQRRTWHQRSAPIRTRTTMIAASSLVGELVAVTALAAGTYYFFIREEPTKKEEEQQTPPAKKSEGIIGLSSSSSSTPSYNKPVPITPTPKKEASSFLLFDSVGVNIEDYLDEDDASVLPEKEKRLQEELEWAAYSLKDLDSCDAIIIRDSEGNLLWESGDLLEDTSEMGTILEQMMKSRRSETFDLTDNKYVPQSFPFLKKETKTVTAVPIGGDGAYLLLGSRAKDFFSDVERRVVTALTSRLSSFLFTSSTS